MRETLLKIFFVAVLVVLFFKPLSLVHSDREYSEIKLLNSMNYYANQYKEHHNTPPKKFTDFVEFDPLIVSNNERLNIYAYYHYFNKDKHIKGYNTSEMTIYFDRVLSSKPVTFVLVDGMVYIDNTTNIVSEI